MGISIATARKQNKIAIFEKRMEIYTALLFLIDVVEISLVTPKMTVFWESIFHKMLFINERNHSDKKESAEIYL